MNSIQAIMGKDMRLLLYGAIVWTISLFASVYYAIINQPIEAIFPLFVFITALFLCGLLFLLKFIDCVMGDYEL